MRSYIVPVTLLIALMLQIMPMPIEFHQYRPDWVFMALAYWTLALPNRVNVGVAFVNGLVLDILLGTTLGVHSMALSTTVFVLAVNYQRLRNYSLWQQAFIIGILSAFYHLLVFWLQHLLTDIYFIFTYLWPVVTTMALWPWVFMLLRKLRRQMQVN